MIIFRIKIEGGFGFIEGGKQRWHNVSSARSASNRYSLPRLLLRLLDLVDKYEVKSIDRGYMEVDSL